MKKLEKSLVAECRKKLDDLFDVMTDRIGMKAHHFISIERKRAIFDYEYINATIGVESLKDHQNPYDQGDSYFRRFSVGASFDKTTIDEEIAKVNEYLDKYYPKKQQGNGN